MSTPWWVPAVLQATTHAWFSIARARSRTDQCSMRGIGQPEAMRNVSVPESTRRRNSSGKRRS